MSLWNGRTEIFDKKSFSLNLVWCCMLLRLKISIPLIMSKKFCLRKNNKISLSCRCFPDVLRFWLHNIFIMSNVLYLVIWAKEPLLLFFCAKNLELETFDCKWKWYVLFGINDVPDDVQQDLRQWRNDVNREHGEAAYHSWSTIE